MGDDTTLVTVAGEVTHPASLRASDLANLADAGLTADFHCHEGWSRYDINWRGVSVATLLDHVGANDDGRFVTFAAGGFSVVLTREQAEDERVLLALERDGVPLDAATGLPRLVGPSEWDCFLSVKSVDRIEVTREPDEATAKQIALARIGR